MLIAVLTGNRKIDDGVGTTFRLRLNMLDRCTQIRALFAEPALAITAKEFLLLCQLMPNPSRALSGQRHSDKLARDACHLVAETMVIR